MLDKVKKLLKSMAVRHYMRVVAFAVLGVVIGGAVVTGIQNYYQTNLGEQQIIRQVAVEANEYVLPASKPTQIRIPSVGIEATFEASLGVDGNQEIEVPDSFETVGYYKFGPTPGEKGPAVVLGHVDSFEGPAIFWSLGQLEPGETFEIDREDGSTATFEVLKLDRPKQSEFPTKEVYGNLDYAGIRLITCSGYYDKGKLKYSNNLIVYGKLVQT